MIRRAHQIAVAVFVRETAELGVTTTQYGIMYLLGQRPEVDQASAARLLGLDRSTTGMVVAALERNGLVERAVGATDRRRRSLRLTPAGFDLLAKLHTPAARAVARLLEPLDPTERPVFLRLLAKLTAAFNQTSRVPLLSPAVDMRAPNDNLTGQA